ncbi:hypothetical protein [Zooshikella sp. RANM57]|uniref:hypothetical protein n=1 Tax=Zooshikella sp. RANM57 TaxID=3425863 RepID=UPI003D6F86CD
MPEIIVTIAGFFPMIIFPAATVIQLVALLKSKTGKGVSKMTWFLFGVANIGAYLMSPQNYAAIQSIIGFLGTALIDFVIVFLAFKYELSERNTTSRCGAAVTN